jgi:K+-sensing histidine kinase KdpD
MSGREHRLGQVIEPEPRAVSQLKMLQRLARRLNELNDVAQIGEAITVELRALIDYHNCRVHLLADDRQTLLPIAFLGELSEYQGVTFDALTLRVGQGITGHVALTGESHYAPDADRDPLSITIPGTSVIEESLLVVPLLYGQRVIGTVALAKLGIDQFDAEDLRLLEVLASHAAVAIENARLLDAERQAARTSDELLRFSKALTGLHTVEAVLSEAAAPIPAMISCAGVQVYSRDARSGAFRIVTVQGQGASEHLEPMEVSADTASRLLLSLEEPFVLPSDVVATVPDEYRAFAFAGEILVAPLRWEPDGPGALVILAPSASARFSARDVELARGICDITSLALGNASRIAELSGTAERLQRLDEMKNMFLGAVSHELRTPLAAVLAIASTLQRPGVDITPDVSERLLARLAANAHRLERLLSDLLDLDRLARGIIEPRREPTDVAALIQRVLENSDAREHEVSVHVDTVIANVDGPKVERILENLLANTVRHTPPRTRLWVRATSTEEGTLLVVEDDGGGVPEELRTEIFEPFRQGPERSPHSPGVGIGLSLVARFAELHGGRAWVEERPGGGASFHVLLPDRSPE